MKYKLLIIMLLSVVLTVGCADKKTEPSTRSNLKLGTLVSVTLYEEDPAPVFDAIFKRIDEIESLMSANITTSEVSLINSNAGKKATKVSTDTFTVIEESQRFGALSEGQFDITVAPLVNLWGIGSDKARLPAEHEIKELLPMVNYRSIEVDRDAQTIRLPQENMAIDLGGIAKGHTANAIVQILNDHQVSSAIIDLGGNIHVHGMKSKDQLWSVGIQNPFSSRGDYIGIVELSDSSVVTSGIYERYLEEDGKRYHHILDPANGYPVENELAGVSIIHSNSMTADAYSTILFAQGLEKGLATANATAHLSAIFVTKDHEVYVSDDLKGRFNMTNGDFIEMN